MLMCEYIHVPSWTRNHLLRAAFSVFSLLVSVPTEPMLDSSALDSGPPEGERMVTVKETEKRRLMPLRVTELLINRVKHLLFN